MDIEEIRTSREKECFPYINRGKWWFDSLSDEKLEELRQWYIDWLNAPATQVIPEKPSWLD